MSDEAAKRYVRFGEDPDHPGWHRWEPAFKGRFLDLFGPVRARPEGGDRHALRCVIETERRHSNGYDALHGGFLMAVVDMALFWPGHYFDLFEGGGAVTLETSCQFVGATRMEEPIEAVSEILRTTGKLVFVRGLIEQRGEPVVNFSGTLRKIGRSFLDERR